MADQRFVLTNCCCGLSLRTGSLIIAVITLLFSLAEAGYGIYLGVSGVPEGWFDLTLDIINIIFAAILIHGVRTENRNLVVAWVWVTAITVGLAILMGVLFIILTSSFIAGIILFFIAALQIYFILVVRSYAISLEGLTTPQVTV